MRLELKSSPKLPAEIAFVANDLHLDARSRVGQIVDGLGHMAMDPAEVQREQERMEELKGIDSVASHLWAYIENAIQKQSSHLGFSNALAQLAVVPRGRDYKEPVKALVQKHHFKLEQLHSIDELTAEQKLEHRLSESIVLSGIRYFREPEDLEFILPFLKSTEPSVVSHSISWMSGYADKDAILILENYEKMEGLQDYQRNRASNAIRNIERRFGLPMRPPLPPTAGAP